MEDWYVYSGVSRSGQPRLWQHRFRQFFVNPVVPQMDKLTTESGNTLTTENGIELEIELGIFVTSNGDYIVTQDINNWEVE